MTKKIAWVTPEQKGGVRSYADVLIPAVRRALEAAGDGDGATLVATFPDLSSSSKFEASLQELAALRPDLVHVQHEYGAFGRKVPPLYCFPAWVKAFRKRLPGVPLVATAHTVLPLNYAYPLRGRGWQIPFRWVANTLVAPVLRQVWGPDTWGGLDGVIVHSARQIEIVEAAGCSKVVEIPHFVPETRVRWKASGAEIGMPGAAADRPREIVVFGYLSPEKGQDIVIEAFARLADPSLRLVLAGGVRRVEDEPYAQHVESRIDRLGVRDRVTVTGYVPDAEIDALYARAALVVAPFRETAGSGSLVQALARGAPVLASDLPLNGEIEERVPGCLEFFEAGRPEDCARRMTELLSGEEGERRRVRLSEAALQYAEEYSVAKIAERHVGFYRDRVR